MTSPSSLRRTAALHRTVLLLGIVALPAVAYCAQGPPRSNQLGQADIAALIRDLGSPVYDKRISATRRLCAAGMEAMGPLRRAASGDDFEVALRAGAVLAVLDQLMFAGVEIRLAFSKSRIAWDEEIELIVTLTNRSRYPAKVPFETKSDRKEALSGNARQVGDFLDVAELLRVTGPDGRELDIRIDDISEDPDVEATVADRAERGPVGHIAPGTSTKVKVAAINRGWARYSMLDAGSYSATLTYDPGWSDEDLAREGVGRVVSNTASVTITTAAPATISRHGVQSLLEVERVGNALVARITNRSDQVLRINKNFGPSAPFARGEWVFEQGSSQSAVAVMPARIPSWDDFAPSLLVEVSPGKSVEIAKLVVKDMHRALADAGFPSSAVAPTAHFVYVNLCDRSWQRRQNETLLGNRAAPPILRALLPRQILSLRHTSNRVNVSTPE